MHPEEEEEHPEKIRVFPIADPNDWTKNIAEIKKTFLRATNSKIPPYLNVQYSFNLDPISCWIRYELLNDLWSETPKRSLPKSETQVKEIAEGFIKRLQQACNEKSYLDLKIVPLLPTERVANIYSIDVARILHYKHQWIDHWLCRFEVRIKAYQNNNDFVPVIGSNIEIRIGQGGNIIAYESRWRPVDLNRYFLTDLHAISEPDEAHGHGGHSNTASANFIYLLDGEHSFQNGLSPYYLAESHAPLKFISACMYSLTIDILHSELLGQRGELQAFVSGGSGNYKFDWSGYEVDNVWDEGYKSYGEGDTRQVDDDSNSSSITLNPGVHNVTVIVLDKETGVVRQKKQVFFVGILEEPNIDFQTHSGTQPSVDSIIT